MSTDNVVITAPNDDAAANNAGAVYLFNGSTGAIISTITGSIAGDNIGGQGVTALANGNFVILSSTWHNGAINNAGAVTWGNGITGISGVVSPANSLVGSTADDSVGAGNTVLALSNGNYVVRSGNWDNGAVANAGAVTWGSGTTGISGTITSANSLVGSTAGDQVGGNILIALSNGNYVVRTQLWNNGAVSDVGAVTWGSGTTGVVGAISAANSLIGSTTNDQVGGTGVFALTNGNYVVRSNKWDNGAVADAGAVTWGSGTVGVKGSVTAANSLVGSTVNDKVGNGDVKELTNGNYVVRSSDWDNGAVSAAGAVTWGSGTSGVAGAVSAANSLVGTTNNNSVGGSGVIALTNGNYVVASSAWDNGATNNVGAVTWGNGTTGVKGAVSPANSLVGSVQNDSIGSGGVTALTNGNYVVRSSSWNNGAVTSVGAATWANGTTGLIGTVTTANSLVGSSGSDLIGDGGIFPLTNGNYVVRSINWDNGAVINASAVTWGNSTTGVVGAITAANSLVGTTAGDNLGLSGVIPLTNGNYVVGSNAWDNGAVVNAGAATWGNGTTGVAGAVTIANSLVGTQADDSVGLNGITALTNGNYLVGSEFWDNGAVVDAGAATWGNGATGITGAVSTTNSLFGTTASDGLGGGIATPLTNGNFVIRTSTWDNGAVTNAGAVTWGNGTTGIVGAVSPTNSLVGSTAFDTIGNGNVTALSNGNYLVASLVWDNGAINAAGAVTWGSGTSGAVGTIGATNSLIGAAAVSGLSTVALDDSNRTFFGRFVGEAGGRVRVGSTLSGVSGNADPILGGTKSSQNVNDNATLNLFSSVTVADPDNQNMFARVTILNGAVRGDFTAGSAVGWTRTVAGNDIKYERFFNPQSNIGSVVQTAIRAFVFQPRSNAVIPNKTELTDFTLFVNDGVTMFTKSGIRVVTTSVNNAPSIGGANPNAAVNDNATVNPFSTLTVTDPDNQEILAKITIFNGTVRGDFTNAISSGWSRSTLGNDINYVRYFSPGLNVGATVQAAYRALIFQPRNNVITPGTTELTDFLVSVSDGVASPVVNQATRLTTSSVNDVPTISGAVAGQTMNDNQTKTVFSTLTVADADTQTLFARVTIVNGVNRGDFTAASTPGWSRTVLGSDIKYERFFNAASNIGATVQVAIRAFVFQPRNNVSIGTTETTGFTVFLNDGIANTTNSTTSVITTGVAPRPATTADVAILPQDTTTIVLPTITKASANLLARRHRKFR